MIISADAIDCTYETRERHMKDEIAWLIEQLTQTIEFTTASR